MRWRWCLLTLAALQGDDLVQRSLEAERVTQPRPPEIVAAPQPPAPSLQAIQAPRTRAPKTARGEPLVRLSVRVLDAVVGSIPGAWVTVHADAFTTVMEAGREGLLFAKVPAGELRLTVFAHGYAERTLRAQAPGHIDVRLVPGAYISGRVLSAEERAPLASVQVIVGDQLGHRRKTWMGITNEDGRFEIQGVEPGLHHLWVQDPSWISQQRGPVVVPIAGSVQDLELLAEPAHFLLGQVRSDEEDFCTSGSVFIKGRDQRAWTEHPFREGEPIEQGGLRKGLCAVRVRCDEGAERSFPPVPIKEPVHKSIWKMPAGNRVMGVVLDRNFQPVAAVQVSLLSKGRAVASATTEQDGRFEVRGLAAGFFKVKVEGALRVDPGYLRAPQTQVPELIIDRPGRLKGRLVTIDEAPMPFWDVHVCRIRGKTDSTGRFFFPSVPSGSCKLMASHPQYSGRSDPEISAIILINPGETQTATVVAPISLGRITGSLVDLDDLPVSGAMVRAVRVVEDNACRAGPLVPSPQTVITDGDGRFSITRLPIGAYYISARAFARGERCERGFVGDDLNLVLDEIGQLYGSVQYEDGARPKRFTVQLSSKRFSSEQTFANADGAFSFSELPFGDYRLAVTAESAKAAKSISIQRRMVEFPGTIVLSAGHAIGGRLVNFANGAPVGGARVEITDPVDGKIRGTFSDEEGVFEFRGVSAGLVSLAAGSPEGSAGLWFQHRQQPLALGDLVLAPKREPVDLEDFGLQIGGQRAPGTPTGVRLTVTSVALGGEAEYLGIQPGLRITRVNGQRVTGYLYYLWTEFQAMRTGSLALTFDGGQTVVLER